MSRSTLEGSPQERILRIAGRLRALCNRGLRYARNPYEIENLEQKLELSADLTALVDGRPLAQIRRRFQEERHYLTPYTVVDTAVFDGDGRVLLIRRADNGRWALPGGWCEVDELPGEGAVREVWEETGCRVDLSGLLGIFDNNYHGGQGLDHLYCLLFAARHVEGSAVVTRETLDVGWFAAQDVPWEELHEAHPARIRFAFRWLADPALRPFYDRPRQEPGPTWQHGAGAEEAE